MQKLKRVLKPESIRAECEASLRRLGIERIDLYQLHRPDESGIPIEDSWAEMLRLIEQGKVRLGGVSNFDVGLLERCAAIRHVDSLQGSFSLIRRDVAARDPMVPARAAQACSAIVPCSPGCLQIASAPKESLA